MITTLAQFYEAVQQLAEDRKTDPRPLEEYLRALWDLIAKEKELPTYFRLFEMCRESYSSPAPDFDDSWMDLTEPPEITETGEDNRELALHTLAFLIADLRRMEVAGTLAQGPAVLWGGVDSPTGHRWYNFQPATFIECGARGGVGIAGEDSKAEAASISWAEVASIIDLGRIYE